LTQCSFFLYHILFFAFSATVRISLKAVGRGKWNHNIDQASKEARKAHWIWKNKGNSNGSTESEKKDIIKKKQTLRQVQRQAYASKKDKLISEIMEASQNDSKTFHKLLRMQRSNSAINTDTLVIDNVESLYLSLCSFFLYHILFFAFSATVRISLIFPNKGNNKTTELRTILQRESQNSQSHKQTKSVNNRKTVKTVKEKTNIASSTATSIRLKEG
jgi:hypothetical protein